MVMAAALSKCAQQYRQYKFSAHSQLCLSRHPSRWPVVVLNQTVMYSLEVCSTMQAMPLSKSGLTLAQVYTNYTLLVKF